MRLIQSGHVSPLFSESDLSHFVMNEETVLAFLAASSKSALSYIIIFFSLIVLNNEMIANLKLINMVNMDQSWKIC